MDAERFGAIVREEHQHYIDYKIARPEHEAADIQMATQRALTRVALSSFSPEEITNFKNNGIGGEARHDALHGEYEGKVYLQDYVKTLNETQLAQLITLHALRPIRMMGTDKQFVLVYDEEVEGFRVAQLPQPVAALADTIEIDPTA